MRKPPRPTNAVLDDIFDRQAVRASAVEALVSRLHKKDGARMSVTILPTNSADGCRQPINESERNQVKVKRIKRSRIQKKAQDAHRKVDVIGA